MNKQRLQIGISSIFFGLTTCIIAYFFDNELLRAALALPYLLLLWPYALSLCIYPKSISLAERFLLGAGLGILALYPLGILVTVIEGKSGEAIFSSHLVLDSILLILSNLIFISIAYFTKAFEQSDKFEKPDTKKIIIFALAFFFLFWNLGRADLNTDEVDIGYSSYDLVDGMAAGRNAYFISTHGHTPLVSTVNHFGAQLINDSGFEDVSDWALRSVNAFTAFLSLLFLSFLLRKYPKNFQYAVLILTLSSATFLFTGRVILREVFMMLFVLLSLSFLQKFVEAGSKRDLILCGIFSAAIMLSKSVVFYIPLIIGLSIFLSSAKADKLKNISLYFGVNFILFLPVIIFNIGSYLKTGYMDILFSKVFGIYNPAGYTGDRAYESGFVSNMLLIIKNFSDQYSFLALLLLTLGLFAAMHKFLRGKLNKEDSFLLLLLSVSLLFFASTGLRAYYLIFLAPVFIYFIVKGILILRYKVPQVLVSLLLLINISIISFNTHISEAYTVEAKWNDSGRSGMPEAPIELFRAYSLTIRPWVENYAWKELRAFKELNFNEDTRVVLGEGVDVFIARKYLNVNQIVKKYYLGENAREDFKVVEETDKFDYKIDIYDEGEEGYEIKKRNGEIIYIIQESGL
jgi:hypothetical protein